MPLFRRSEGRVVKPFGRGLGAEIVRITLCDTSAEMVDAWIDTFRDVEAVEIRLGDLVEVRSDAMVSPANSFGDMSGGLDKHIDDHFNGAAQRAVVEAIRSEFLGELPVGLRWWSRCRGRVRSKSSPRRRCGFRGTCPTA